MRALELEELQHVAPPRPDPEPIPSFTHQFHDGAATCSQGHLFSYATTMRNRIIGWSSDIDRLCPHCEREAWHKANAGKAEALRAYEHDRAMAEAAERGEWAPHKPRKITLREAK